MVDRLPSNISKAYTLVSSNANYHFSNHIFSDEFTVSAWLRSSYSLFSDVFPLLSFLVLIDLNHFVSLFAFALYFSLFLALILLSSAGPSGKLLLDLASTIILGFMSRWDPRLRFLLSPRHLYVLKECELVFDERKGASFCVGATFVPSQFQGRLLNLGWPLPSWWFPVQPYFAVYLNALTAQLYTANFTSDLITTEKS
jgi:hypothetical protein